MCWSINHDVIHYISSSEGNLCSTSEIALGQSVLLRKGEIEFNVVIEALEGENFSGTVRSIGPNPSLQAGGITRGQVVVFNQIHVFRVYIDTGATE